MKLVKSLLLGSAAGLLAVAGAQAADLPARKAAPVEYVRVCDAYGGGFFYLPGIAGDVCLRVGGRLRFEAVFMNAQNALSVTGIGTAAPGLSLIPRKGQDQYGFRTQGQVNLDVRKQTDFGTARAFVSFYIRRNSGVLNTGVGGGTAIPTGTVSTGYLGVGRADSVPSLNSAYIQFAGVTAGFTGSFFNFYADAYNYEGMLTADFTSNLLAYTATFGNGFSASISLEDKGAHQAGTGGLSSNFGSGAFLQHGSASASPVQRTPFLVANVRVDQAWGSAQIAGMIQQINTVATAGNAALLPANVLPLAAVQPGGPAVPAAYTGPASASKFGFGIMAGAEFNLPMIGAGDQLWLQAAYANGALDALGIPSDGNLNGGFTRLLGGFQRGDRDAIAVANTTAAGVVTGYSLEREKGYNLAADFLHFWSPQLFSNFAATYTRINPGTVTRNTAWYLGGLGTGSEYRLQASLVWRPTPGLDIGLEVTYARLRQTLAQNTGSGVFTPLPAGIPLNPQALEGRLRLQRDF